MKKISLKFTSPQIASQGHRADLVLLGSVLVLALFGLLMVYDASQFEAFQSFGDKYYFIKQQTLSFILGLFSLVFFSLLDYHRLQKIALLGLLSSLLLLLLVFIPGLGVAAYGAHRWLRVFGFTIQPAEIIKLSTVIFLADLFSRSLPGEKKSKLGCLSALSSHKGKSALRPFLLLVVGVSLIVGVFQKDLGSAVVFNVITLGTYFVAGAPLVHFLGFLAAGFLAMVGLVLAAPYRIKRVLAFLDPFTDSQGFSYHITQVLIALGSGGFLGLGVGQSRQKFAYIPEVTTDSIFSIVGEEFGFIGGTILISLFGFLIIRGLKITQNAADNFGKFLAAGLTVWLGVQAVVNLAAMVSLIPLTGVPLPFISFGGSALLVNLIAVGILLNISKQTTTK